MALDLLLPRNMETGAVSSARRLLLIAAAAAVSFGACVSESCDTAPYYTCSGGVIYEGGCGGPNVMIGQCAQGCARAVTIANQVGCAFAICRENEPKAVGDACQSATDCAPTPATVATSGVTNTYLSCDAAAHACVRADPPAVADWLAPCDPFLVARLQSKDEWLDNAVQDPSCAEGWCAVSRHGTTGCVANACTRACTGDQDCPSGATCQYKEFPGCDYQPEPSYCKPGGPAGIGFTCS